MTDHDRGWPFPMIRSALFGLGGASQRNFLWTRLMDSRFNQLHLPMGILEMTPADAAAEARVTEAVKRAGIPITLPTRPSWAHNRENASNNWNDNDNQYLGARSTDQSQVWVPERRVAPWLLGRRSAPWRNGVAAAAAAASQIWFTRGETTSTTNVVTDETKFDSLIAIVAVLFVGMMFGFMVSRCAQCTCVGAPDPAMKLPNTPHVSSHTDRETSGTSLKRRASALHNASALHSERLLNCESSEIHAGLGDVRNPLRDASVSCIWPEMHEVKRTSDHRDVDRRGVSLPRQFAWLAEDCDIAIVGYSQS